MIPKPTPITTSAPTVPAPQEASEHLRTSEIRYRRLFESARDGILILDAVTRQITDVNPFLIELLGYSREEFLGRELWELGLLKDEAASAQAFRELQENRYIRYDDLPLETKDGRSVSVEFVSNVYAEDGKQVIQCNIRDISERKAASAAEQESKRFLQATLDALASHIAVLDQDGTIIAVNKAWRRFAEENDGTAASCGVGANYLEVCRKASGAWSEQAPSVTRGIREVIAGCCSDFCLEYPCHSPSEQRWFNVRVTRFEGEGPVRVAIAHENISERKRAEETLGQSEARFRTAIAQAPLPIIIHREDGQVLQLSRGWTQFSGYELEDIPTIHAWAQRAYGKSSAQAQDYMDELYQITETREEGEWTITAKNGEERVWEFRSTPLGTFGDGQHIVISAALDVTERKRAENALRASEERFQSIVANVPGMVYQFVQHPDGSLEWPFVSQGCREIYEVEPQVLVGNPSWHLERIHPDDLSEFDRSMAASARTLGAWSWEGHHRLPSGKVKWIQGTSRPQRLPDGGTLWNGLVMDITARKEAEAERDRFFTMSLDMLGVAGLDGYFKRLNPAFAETLGFSNAELMARPFLEFVHPDDRAATLKIVEQLADGNHVVGFENRYLSKDGSWRWLEWKSAIEEGVVYAAARDVTTRKQAEQALHKAKDELELRVLERTGELRLANELLQAEIAEREQTEVELQRAKRESDHANRAKSEFLSRMSHELRTPLNAILGFGQILERQDLTAAQKESTRYILKGGRHLLDLINEVLDIARVESGRVDLSIEPIAPQEVVPEVCDLLRPLAAQHNIRLEQDASVSAPGHVLADRQRLKQVLINLLSNAIKYNRGGGQVLVACRAMPGERIRIEVRDTGLGISSTDLPRLFTPFERLSSINSGIEGTGLGLALSQRLAVMMGGTLEVESVLGQGSTFSIELPRASLEESSASSTAGAFGAGDGKAVTRQPSVLYIEDDVSHLQLIEVILTKRPQVMLLTAMQGSVGLELARHHEPDLILLDVNLPDMPGQEVLARLQRSAITRDIPVVVISVDTTDAQIQQLMEAGAMAYLTKPLEVAELLRLLDRVLPLSESPTPEPPAEEAGS